MNSFTKNTIQQGNVIEDPRWKEPLKVDFIEEVGAEHIHITIEAKEGEISDAEIENSVHETSRQIGVTELLGIIY